MSKFDQRLHKRLKAKDFAQPKAELNPLKVAGALMLVIFILLVAYRCGG